MKLISGNSNRELAEDISDYLDVPLVNAEIKSFSDQETKIEINGHPDNNVRGEDVFVIQSTSQPANHHVMEMLICIDAIRRSSAKRITAVVPYFGYARQDSKPAARTPITAKLMANLISTAGANRVLTVDLHARQIQGFFDIPCDNLFANPVFVKDIQKRFENEKLIIVSPDVGGVVRAREAAKKLNADLSIVDKRRSKANESEVMNIIGEVENQHCIILDDLVDTAGTLCNAATALMDKGALSVHAYATHGVLSSTASERIDATEALSSLTITNTIVYPYGDIKPSDKVRKVSISKLLGRAIKRISEEKSISELFE